MLNILKRAETYVANPGDRYSTVPASLMLAWIDVQRGFTNKRPNRAERRWLERYWVAEEQVR